MSVRCRRCKGLGHVHENCSMPQQPQWAAKQGQQPMEQPSELNQNECVEKQDHVAEKGIQNRAVGSSFEIGVISKSDSSSGVVTQVTMQQHERGKSVIVVNERDKVDLPAKQAAGAEEHINVIEGKDEMQNAGGGNSST